MTISAEYARVWKALTCLQKQRKATKTPQVECRYGFLPNAAQERLSSVNIPHHRVIPDSGCACPCIVNLGTIQR